MWAPDFEFYKDEYRGSLSQDQFDTQLSNALAHVRWLIGFNEVTESTSEQFKRAVCAAIEAFYTYGIDDPVSGFSIGNFSMNSNSSQACNGKSIATETGLLFGGLA